MTTKRTKRLHSWQDWADDGTAGALAAVKIWGAIFKTFDGRQRSAAPFFRTARPRGLALIRCSSSVAPVVNA